jgi:hypothetical protein
MKVLCINGNPRRLTFSGRVYTVVAEETCPRCKQVYYDLAELPSVGTFSLNARCGVCRGPMPRTNRRFQRKQRFIPWRPDELNVTIDEVAKLYQPGPRTKETQS